MTLQAGNLAHSDIGPLWNKDDHMIAFDVRNLFCAVLMRKQPVTEEAQLCHFQVDNVLQNMASLTTIRVVVTEAETSIEPSRLLFCNNDHHNDSGCVCFVMCVNHGAR